jgi:serine/threonine-protein kinase
MALARPKAAKVVGRYQLVTELATSYLGPLWAVRVESAEGATLAMLRLVSLARLDADTRVRLMEAAWQAMEVRDDRVFSVTDVVASDGELGVVSDYVEGVTLRALQGLASVRRKPMSIAVALRVVMDLVEAVSALHRHGATLGEEEVALYGGLSADSILVGTSGRTSVLDVAVASAACAVPSLGGNPERVAYAAPEQLSPEARADARTDVFTLGVLAWELLSGRRLFVGSDKIVAQKVLAAKIPRLDELRRKGDPEVPAQVLAVVTRALERDPANRFARIDELRDALTAAGATPASEEEVASYVAQVAEGALARTRDGLREPVRAASPAKPKVQAPVAAASTVAVGEVKKPAAPAPLAPKPAAASPLKPVLTGGRPRQPTMIGIPTPTREEAEAAARAVFESSENLSSIPPSTDIESIPPSGETERENGTPEARPVQPTMSEEPTGQYNARDLLSQVEAMGRGGDSIRRPRAEFTEPATQPRDEDLLVSRPTAEFQVADAPPPSEEPREEMAWLDEPMPSTTEGVVPMEAAASLIPESVAPTSYDPTIPPPIEDLDAPPSAETRSTEEPPALDEPPFDEPPAPPPASLKFPEPAVPRVQSHAERAIATALARPAERPQAKLPAPAPSTPFIPSQIPPPLIHDPRARGSRSMRPKANAATNRGRSVALGIVLSLTLVIASAAIALVVLRSREEDAPPVRAVVAAVPAPAPAPAPPAPEPAASATAAAVAAAASAPAPEPAAAAPAASTLAPATATAEQPAAPAVAPPPVTSPFTARGAAEPPQQRRPAKKKRSRFVPDDI